MKIKGIAHVGLACADENKMSSTFIDMLNGILDDRTEYLEMQQISSMVKVGDSCLEIMQGTSPDSVIGKYVAQNGQGMHHISFNVEDVVALVESLESRGYRIINKYLDDPHLRYAFIHPKSTGGILIELVEHL